MHHEAVLPARKLETRISPPRVGVVIVAHNRAALVTRAFRSIRAQTLPLHEIEVCLVDAGSTDDTGEVLERLVDESPDDLRVLVLEEPTGSASRARNAGWMHLSAPVVAFLDDDAEAEPPWLESALARLDREPEVAALAGRTLLSWIGPPPTSSLQLAAARFTALDYGPKPRRIRYPRAPIGPNMIVRRAALAACGGFAADLGPAPGRHLVAEEGDLTLRIERNGDKVFYDPDVRVHHMTESARITTSYLIERARIHGRSRSIVDWRHFRARRAPWQVLRLLRGVLRGLLHLRFGVLERADLAYAAAYFSTLAGSLRNRPTRAATPPRLDRLPR